MEIDKGKALKTSMNITLQTDNDEFFTYMVFWRKCNAVYIFVNEVYLGFFTCYKRHKMVAMQGTDMIKKQF